MSKAAANAKPAPQSAAAPSPFPPIGDYAFLSNCHTGALVAPDGAIDWLCVPSFDSPSVFGSLLDREAGFFRIGPFGIDHPASCQYDTGTNVLVTTWKTPRGWIVVRDALTMGPRAHDDRTRADASAADQTIRLVSDIPLGIEGNRARGRHTLTEGDRAYCALSWAEKLDAPKDAGEAEARVAATTRFWRNWLGRARIPDHRFREPVQRSALAIKGLT
jgi:alpha,alpha-trehalase